MKIKAYSLVFGEDIEFEYHSPELEKALHEAEIKELMSEPNPPAKTRKEALEIIKDAYQ